MNNRQLAEEVAQLLATQPGFTIDANGKPLASGYTVGGVLQLQEHALAIYSQPRNPAELQALEDELAGKFEELGELLSENHLGGWRDGGSLVLDLVTVTRNRKQASELAKSRGQLAYGEIREYQYAKEWKTNL